MKKLIGIIIAIVALGALVMFILRPEVQPQEDIENQGPIIEVVSVGEIDSNSAPVVAYGQVVSSNSVAVVPETSGVVKRVYKNLGQTVRAGETIVELQNSTEQQSVLQAQSSLSSAQAGLQRVNRGANSDQLAQARAGVSSAESGLVSVETNVLAGLDALYDELDTVLVSSFSEFFNNPNTTFPSFTQDASSDEVELSLEKGLTELNALLQQDRNYDNVDGAMNVMAGNIALFQSYTNTLRSELLKLNPSASLSQVTITRWGTDLVNTRNELESKKVTLRGLTSQLTSAQKSVISAQEVLRELENGSDREDITIAQSGVTGARSGLSSAQIQLSKTFIKAPTFGRISSIETRVGQLVGPSSPVFVLSSSDAKRIDVFLTEKQVARIAVGSTVTIDGEFEGSVARIAPAIDAQTGKVKVEIFASDIITLTEGAGVGVSIESTFDARGFQIPIEAVFVRGDQAYVYAVVSGKAVPTAIETDGLFGPTVVVTDGITANTKIVSFARIVKDNQIIKEEVQEADENGLEIAE